MAGDRGYGLLIPLSMIWGGAFVAIRQADFELSSVNLTIMRWFIVCAAFVVLYPFIVKPKARFERRDFPRFLVVGAFNVAVYHPSLNFSEKTVDASLAGLLISLAPLFGVVLSSFASGAYTVASKPLVTKYGPIPVSVWTALTGTALLLPLVTPGLLQQAESLSSIGWASVLYLSLLSTVLSNTLYFTLVGRHPVSRLSVHLYLVPLVSVTGGVLLLGESLSAFTVAGGAVLLLAVTLVTRGRR